MNRAKPKQINIRDSDIYARAHRIAKRMRLPMKEIVRQALKDFDAKSGGEAPRDARMELKLAELALIQKRISKTAIKRTHADDDADLYDADGLPR